MLGEVVEQIKRTAQEAVNGAHTAFPGKVVSYDPGSGLAVVEPALQFTRPDGTKMDYPQISGVPVVLIQSAAQDATIAYPIKPGDGCLIIVGEQSLDKWMYNRETDTDLKKDITNSICIPGLFVNANATVKEACADNAVIVKKGGSKIKMTSSKITISSAAIDITASGPVNITGSVVNLN